MSNNNKNKKSKITTSLIASIVVACYITVIAVVGFIGRNSFAPKIIDEIFGLSDYVLEEITKKVDSGYSGTFIITPSSTDRVTQLLFFAEREQTVKVTIKGNSLGSAPNKFRLLIDNKPWGDIRDLPYTVVHGDITDKLKFDEPGANLHVLKLIPEQLGEGSLLVFDCLVLVYNK